MKADWEFVVVMVLAFTAFVLFHGEPDLYDAMMFIFTDGAVPLPTTGKE